MEQKDKAQQMFCVWWKKGDEAQPRDGGKMKIKIVVTREDGKFISIPITKREAGDIYDVFYMMDPDMWPTIKVNKCDKSVIDFHNKLEFLVHDVLGEGKWYTLKGKKLVLGKKRCYLIKKPRWRKK